jgi:cobalt-zinc-cadmium efflux system membrane fusion protein
MARLLLLAALLSGAACSSGGRGNPAAAPAPAPAGNARLTPAQRQNIRLVTVAASRFRKTIETFGAVDFDSEQATSVLAPFGGPVSRLLVSLGQRVGKGEPLAEVQSPDFATAIDAYRKALATARTNRRLADLDQDLLQHHGVSQREAEQAETDAVNAEADRDAALQGLVSLNVTPQSIQDIREGRTTTRPDGLIRSPIAGTVVEKLITPGELLEAGTTPCFTVADLSPVWVLARVFGSELASVSVGDSAEIETGTNAGSLTGRVENIASLVDPDTRAVNVRVVVQNPEGVLRKQMYVRVLIHARQESTGLLVPVAAILRDDENLPFVYVAQPDGSFARQRVTLGYTAGTQVELPLGIHAGDQIVVDGGLFVQFMQAQ